MITKDEIIEIGTLRKPHGTRGEIQMQLTNMAIDFDQVDFPPLRGDKRGADLILEIDNILVPFFLEEYRYKNDETVLLTFEDIRTEERVAQLTGCRVFLHKNQLPEDAEVTLTPTSLIGYTVIDTEQGTLGTITDIDTSTLNPLFALDCGVIFPAHDDFVVEINPESQQLTVRLPEGLLSL